MGMLPRTELSASKTNGSALSADKPLVLALPKGRILGKAVELFGAAGFDISETQDKSRRLIYDCGPLRVLLLRTSDIPTYVDRGAADVGIAGRDTLDEQDRDLYEPLDLRIAACRMVVAEPSARSVDVRSQMHLRIATKYPTITKRYLSDRGITAEVIKLSGAIELGPLTGLADQIVDLVESGETLRQNGLVEVETIMEVTSRLVVNPASLKLRAAAISELIDRLEAQIDSVVG